mgnify:CR=1 FL=1
MIFFSRISTASFINGYIGCDAVKGTVPGDDRRREGAGSKSDWEQRWLLDQSSPMPFTITWPISSLILNETPPPTSPIAVRGRSPTTQPVLKNAHRRSPS